MLRVNAVSLEAVTHTHTLYVYQIDREENRISNNIRDGDTHIKEMW